MFEFTFIFNNIIYLFSEVFQEISRRINEYENNELTYKNINFKVKTYLI
jgi:hypothetical protein